jgi:hypothetical protein
MGDATRILNEHPLYCNTVQCIKHTTNLITELEVFRKDFHNYLRMDHDTDLHLLSLVTPFIAKEDTVMMTMHTCSKRLGKSSLRAEK